VTSSAHRRRPTDAGTRRKLRHHVVIPRQRQREGHWPPNWVKLLGSGKLAAERYDEAETRTRRKGCFQTAGGPASRVLFIIQYQLWGTLNFFFRQQHYQYCSMLCKCLSAKCCHSLKRHNIFQVFGNKGLCTKEGPSKWAIYHEYNSQCPSRLTGRVRRLCDAKKI
jgi:hypothetical protein